jgi:DNA-binding NarL/FixJ family response regulator
VTGLLINIAIIDKNITYRESLKTLLEQVDGFRVVQDSPDGTWVKTVNEKLVQVIIMDGSIGNEKCKEIMNQLSQTGISSKTLILAMFKEELDYDYGNAAVMLKSSGKNEFVRRIKSMFEVDVE